jgi:FAD/FMN-containing dehydrogenase
MPDDDPDPATALRERAHGAVLRPGDPGYDDARTVWNDRIDRHPEIVFRCTGAADVVAGVTLARERDLRLGVRSGGHHVSGCAVPDGGLLLDCRPMDAVRVDPDARRARVGPGATWGDVDHETGTFGLAVPGGQDPNIGVAGLTLGGGVGWLSRKHGLTCDNLLAADVVTADGNPVRASADRNEDLFWALRGGGGNVGVVTAFEFRLHELPPEILAGSLVYPADEFAAVADRYRRFMTDAPPEVRLLVGSMALPPASVYPDDLHGTRVTMLITCYAGPPAEGEQVLAPLRAAGDPIADSIRPRSYESFQAVGESRGAIRTFLRSQYLASLPAPAVETIREHARRAPSAGATVFLSPRGGAETVPAADATAYPHRDACHHLLVEARWEDPSRDDEHVEWVRTLHEALGPYTTGAAAMNFLTDDEGHVRVGAAYGENYDRLAAVKREWDPENLFRANQNVPPAD